MGAEKPQINTHTNIRIINRDPLSSCIRIKTPSDYISLITVCDSNIKISHKIVVISNLLHNPGCPITAWAMHV